VCDKVWRAHLEDELLVDAPATSIGETFGLDQYTFGLDVPERQRAEQNNKRK
jgi:hypothetical protein